MINIANTNTYKIKEIIEDLKQQLTAIYGDRLCQLILFGSLARGDAKPDSDIDILVVLKDDVNPVDEIENNSYFISNFCLKYDQDISCFYLAENKLKLENNLFIQNIKKDGIIL